MKLVQLVTFKDKIIGLDDKGNLYRLTFDVFGTPSITPIWISALEETE